MNQQFGPLLCTISVWALPAIIAITFHEAAHGFVARLLGDDTAWRLGRVTFNPLKHIDPFGTILLPGLLLFLHSPFLFGYAKPVPINFRALNNPRRDMVLVAAVSHHSVSRARTIAGLSLRLSRRWVIRPPSHWRDRKGGSLRRIDPAGFCAPTWPPENIWRSTTVGDLYRNVFIKGCAFDWIPARTK
jgi:hypothetical protein